MGAPLKIAICVAATVVATLAMGMAVITFIGPYPTVTMLLGMPIGCAGVIACMVWLYATP